MQQANSAHCLLLTDYFLSLIFNPEAEGSIVTYKHSAKQ
jgi:hypothetical protein